MVTWWETNETSDIPVMKVSNDFGRTFGPMLKLASNGTIASGEVEPYCRTVFVPLNGRHLVKKCLVDSGIMIYELPKAESISSVEL